MSGSLNSLISPTLRQNSPLSQLFAPKGPSSQSSDSSLNGVIAKLASAVTGSDGKLDTSSPLGKMLEKFVESKTPDGLKSLMGGDVASHMTPDGIKKALGDMIKDKLGENFGAASNLPNGGGLGGSGGLSGSSGTGGQGDLMSQVLGGLGKSEMDSMLTDNASRGGSDFTDADKPALTEVARFMDEHPETFGKPDDANGKVGSWADEINSEGDTYLNQDETDKFRGAMDEIGQQMQSGNAQNAGLLGGGSGLQIGDSNGAGGGGGLGGGQGESSGSGTSATSGSTSSSNETLKLELELMLALLTASSGNSADDAGDATDSISDMADSGNDSSSSAPNKSFGPSDHGGQGGVSHHAHHQSLQNDAQLAAGNVLSKLLG